MGRKSCRKQRKQQQQQQQQLQHSSCMPGWEEDSHNGAGCPYTRAQGKELRLVHPEGNFASDLPWVINTLRMRDGEQWEDWEQQHDPASVRDLTMVVLGYLDADMGGVPSSEQEGEEQSLPFPVPEWEEPECPTPEWEEPGRPTPEWEEPGRPTPEREESGRPQPEREESGRPQPEREESGRPQPREGGVEASIAFGPKPPAEGECLLVPPLQPGPTPEWEEPGRPTPEWEEPGRPTPEWEEPGHPTPEWEEPGRPTPEWEESGRPQPKREESGRPQPKREESGLPQP
ncbi:UNVERIFIED_CONTAM: hypothetical protein FKN15_046566 [Acipenser sinensis]